MSNKEKLNLISKCKTVNEVIELAKKENKNLTKEEAQKLFNMTHDSKLSDDELSNVAGGIGGCGRRYMQQFFPNAESVTYIAQPGDAVQFYTMDIGTLTQTGRVKTVTCEKDNLNSYYDVYIVEATKSDGTSAEFRCTRDYIQMP